MTLSRAEMDEQWGYVGAKSRQRWLFYAYDRIRDGCGNTYSVNGRCPRWSAFWACCRPLRFVVWMNDGWPLYESRSKENCTLSASDIRSALSGITPNLRQHPARLGRKSLSFSKSVELHDKVIGHYLNINTISKLSRHSLRHECSTEGESKKKDPPRFFLLPSLQLNNGDSHSRPATKKVSVIIAFIKIILMTYCSRCNIQNPTYRRMRHSWLL